MMSTQANPSYSTFYCAVFLLLTSMGTNAQTFEIDDQLLLLDAIDHEFDRSSNERMSWHNGNEIWVAAVDSMTGTISPPDGRGDLVTLDAPHPNLFGNGAEWAHGDNNSYIVYHDRTPDVGLLAWEEVDGQWIPMVLERTRNRAVPVGSAPGSAFVKIAYYKYLFSPLWARLRVFTVRELNGPGDEISIPGAENARWLDGDRLVTAIPDQDGVLQSAIFTYSTGDIQSVTIGPGDKKFSHILYAPEYDANIVVCTNREANAIQFWLEMTDGQFELLDAISSPVPERPHVRVPEPFAFHGKTYVAFVVSEKEKGGPGNPSEVWLASVDPAGRFLRQISRDNPGDRYLLDPEFYLTAEKAYIFYSEILSDINGDTWSLRRADTGL